MIHHGNEEGFVEIAEVGGIYNYALAIINGLDDIPVEVRKE